MDFVEGSKVKFTGKADVHPTELQVASSMLEIGKEYTVNFVNKIFIDNQVQTFLFVDGVPGQGFKDLMFELVEVVECISH